MTVGFGLSDMTTSRTYLITGGAIKLTATMSERPHTLAELAQLEKVRNKLIDLGVYDIEGLNDYNNEQNN